MCGIAGILNHHAERVDPELLHRMIDTLRHRGPDASGIHVNQHVGLGHARLSIIDLENGAQPMTNEDGSLWLVFNGEIYNYVELRTDLERRGHRFATRSDTEVILHLYEEQGPDCVQGFNGQWALALWDERKRILWLSRDRLGVRPLFYTQTEGEFLFASEIKAILSHPAVRREIDLQGLDQVFTFWCPRPPRTLFKNIKELPPGHSLILERNSLEVRPYWHLEYGWDDHIRSEQAYTEELHYLLVEAARIRLRSDVPVGAYLSGGLDSTVITAIIRRYTNTPLKTFSIAFEDPAFDESAYQREAAAFLGTDHHEIRCTNEDIAGVFPAVIRQTEQPVLRTAPAPLYLLSSLVNGQGYKVVLTGEGADEMLGGYDIFKEAKIRRFWGACPGSKRRPLLLRRLYPYLENIQSQSEAYLKAFFHVRPDDLSDPLFSHIPRWDLTAKLKRFFSDNTREALRGYDARIELRESLSGDFFRWDPFSQAQYLETTCLLPGYILSSQGDRMAMAHSVEGRFPFLDHRVVEFAARVPPRLKMRALNEKYLLKQAARSLVPAGIIRRPKQPYRAPEAGSFWINGRSRQEYVEDVLSPDRIRANGIFNPAAVQTLVEKAKADRVVSIKDNMALVGILSTQLMVEQLVKNYGKYPIHARN